MWKPLLLSIALWQACLALAALITVIIGSEVDESVLVPCAIVGLAVATTVTLTVRQLKKGWAALTGFAIGLLPTVAGLTYGYFSPKTVDAAAGWLALSLWLAVPSAVGGALSGFISARPMSPKDVVTLKR
jgi:hypothetical protein